MSKVQTKAELQTQNVELRLQVEQLETADADRRREFASAFEWRKPKSAYESVSSLESPSWEKIFVQIGKLLANQEQMNTLGKLEKLNTNFFNILYRIEQCEKATRRDVGDDYTPAL